MIVALFVVTNSLLCSVSSWWHGTQVEFDRMNERINCILGFLSLLMEIRFFVSKVVGWFRISILSLHSIMT